LIKIKKLVIQNRDVDSISGKRTTYILMQTIVTELTRKAWQSLAYSPLGAEVSPLANANETHLLTDRHLA